MSIWDLSLYLHIRMGVNAGGIVPSYAAFISDQLTFPCRLQAMVDHSERKSVILGKRKLA